MITTRKHTGLTTVSCAATEASRTISLDRDNELDRITSVGMCFDFTANAAGATVVTVTLWKSADGGTTWGRVPAWSYAGSGSYSGSDYSQTISLATSDTFWVDVDVKNSDGLKMVFSTDTADADDTMSVFVSSDYHK